MYFCTHENNTFDILNVFKHNLSITVNRSGETGRTYVVPSKNSSYGGSYTCLVTVSSVTSEESSGVKITAAGI